MNKEKVIDLLLSSTKVSIYAHINTDSDAIGSSLALREALIQLGKQVDVFVHSDFPSNFEFYGDLSFYNKKQFGGKYDLAVCLDTATENRLGKYKYFYRKNIKNTLAIDHHHLSNENYCKYNYIQDASSTCEILFDILKDLKIKFTNTICRNLLSGIITDTGKFMHSATSKTFDVVGKLLKFGNLKIEDVTLPLLNAISIETFNLIRQAYNQMEFFADNKLAFLMFRNCEFEKLGVSIDDTSIISEIALQIKTVQFSILASEDDKGYFRVSFRSKGDISAKQVAEIFGGGGHVNASGCKIFGNFDDVKQRLIDSAMQTLGWK